MFTYSVKVECKHSQLQQTELAYLCNKCLTFDFMFMICIPTSLTPMWHNMEDLLLGCRLPVKKADPYTVNFLQNSRNFPCRN